jgi:NAD+ kinase
MNEPSLPFNRIAIIAHPKLPGAAVEADHIAQALSAYGVHTETGFLYDETIHQRVKLGDFDLLIALGGDGTMLRAGHLCGPYGVPVMGVNIGRFGFLMEIRQQQWNDFLPRLMSRDYWIEKRMMLCAEQWRGGDKLGSWDVLNEVVVSRGQFIRPVHLTTTLDRRHLATYVADALIVSTPTGSTAYALAAGGPILPPELRNILLVPVAPHLSLERAIVLSESTLVSITIQADHQAVFSIDGQVPIGLSDDDRVDVYASKHTVQFIRFEDPGYFYRNLTAHMSKNPTAGNYR